jgi:hypothetical protein
MKIKKTVTENVVVANRANSKKGTGARTQRGKETVSQNATKHGVLSRRFHFRGDKEKAAYDTLISALDMLIKLRGKPKPNSTD